MDLKPLIASLADGEYHSGSELGQLLGVSRTAIWKALDRISEFGLSYESQKGLGYRLEEPVDLIDQSELERLLSQHLGDRIAVQSLLSCESTNLELLSRFRELGGKYCAVLAEKQTAGRGRRGRSWCSPFAKNIYMSLGFEWNQGVNSLQGLSVVIGIAVASYLRDQGLEAAAIKWPNDIWVDDKKLAGILIELQGEVSSAWRVTVGLGLNVSMGEKDAEEIDQPWCSLSDYINVSRTVLSAQLINVICDAIDEFSEKGFAAFISRFDNFDALRGRRIRLIGPDVEGVIEGLDVTGALLLRTKSGVEAYSSGEISVRPL